MWLAHGEMNSRIFEKMIMTRALNRRALGLLCMLMFFFYLVGYCSSTRLLLLRCSFLANGSKNATNFIYEPTIIHHTEKSTLASNKISLYLWHTVYIYKIQRNISARKSMELRHRCRKFHKALDALAI